jgi:4-hydroxy-4-methyl-2-oxoglutarate aldolase
MNLLPVASVLTAAGTTARRVNGLEPLTSADAICAPAATCACAPRDNLAVYRLLAEASAGSALVIEAGGRLDGGYFGELVAIEAGGRGLRGLVIDGSIRDGRPIADLDFPVFHAGLEPTTCVKEQVLSVGEPVLIGGVEVAPGDQVVADCDGVLVVPSADWPEVEAAAREIEEREDELRNEIRSGRHLADLLGLP